MAGRSSHKNDTWVSSKPSNADFTSDAASTGPSKVVWVGVSLSGSSSPGGTFAIKGSIDDSHYEYIYFDANKVYGETNGGTYSHAGGNTIAFSGASDSYFLIPIENPPPYIKLIMDNTAGGTTGNRLNARWWSRPI